MSVQQGEDVEDMVILVGCRGRRRRRWMVRGCECRCLPIDADLLTSNAGRQTFCVQMRSLLPNGSESAVARG